jgi:hypothetical protein
MDATRFDVFSKRFASSSTRRTALRLLSAGLLGALLPASARAAQRSDRDNDGLFDDDETDVYGTNPDIPDTDGDGVGDGQEICNQNRAPGCDQDQVHTNPLVNENAAPPPPTDPAPVPAPTCVGVGGACSAHSNCCGYDTPNILCCFDANGFGVCTDVSVNSFLCPAPGVPDTGCAVGMTNCGGFCTDLSIDHGNCGSCGNSCPIDSNCMVGACVQACPRGGLTICNGVCVDLLTDYNNCGACGNTCVDDCAPDEGGYCNGGSCACPF